MRAVIIARKRMSYSTQRLWDEFSAQGAKVSVLDPLEVSFAIPVKLPGISDQIVVPRFGHYLLDLGLVALRSIQRSNSIVLNSACAISLSKHKFQALQVLSHAGIPVPRTEYYRTRRQFLLVANNWKFPVVVKKAYGACGHGVFLIHEPATVEAMLTSMTQPDQSLLVQEYIQEAKGKDIRAFVVGERVIAGVEKKAAKGDFRANVLLGASSSPTRLSSNWKSLAVQSTKALGLDVAGVDIIGSKRGPLVIEVNSTPGLRTVEECTDINVARAMVEYAIRLSVKQQP